MTEATKLTAEALRGISEGESLTIRLPDNRAVRNAKAYAYQVAPIQGCKYSVRTDYTKNEITITRKPTTP